MGRTKELFAELREQDPHHIIQDQLMSIIGGVEDGNVSVLDGLIEVKQHQEHLENSLELVKAYKDQNFDMIEAEAKEHEGLYRGFEVGVRNGGRYFTYKRIKKWQEIEAEKKRIEEQAKQAFLNKEKGLLTATQDGEEIELPEVNYRKSSVIVNRK